MKKVLIFFVLFLSFATTVTTAFAMGSPQSSNPNGANYVAPKATKILANPALGKTKQYWKKKFDFFDGSDVFALVQKAIITTGPKMAAKLNNISGQIFGILTVLAFIWLMMPMWFKDIDWGAIVMFWVKVLMLYGMLRWYNYFWNEGIVGFFIYLKNQIGAQHMVWFVFSEFGKIFMVVVYSFVGGSVWGIITGGWPLAALLFIDAATLLILLVALMMTIGTIYLVQIYIVIALVTGYIFIPFSVIKQGEFLFNGWLKFLISSAFSYFLVSLVIKVFEEIFSQIAFHANVNTVLSLGFQFAVLTILVMFTSIVMKIPSLAGEIIAGTPNISIGSAAAVAVGVASMAAGVGRIGAAAATGGTSEVAVQSAKFLKHFNKIKNFKGARNFPKNRGGDEK